MRKSPVMRGSFTQTPLSHSDANQLGGNRRVSWGAPEVWGDLGESTRIYESEPIAHASLSKIAHVARFLQNEPLAI
jgi:hypothetical protein